MKITELLDSLNNGRTNKAEIKSKQKLTICIAAAAGLAAGVILTLFFQMKSPKISNKKRKDTVKKVKKTVNDTVDIVADSADKAEQKVNDGIANVSKNSKDMKNDIAEGLHGVTDEIKKTADHASKQLNKSKK